MKKHVLVGLVSAQMILAAQPAAAGFEEASAVQNGTFAGARIRISLGGKQQDRNFRAGLTIAPTLRSQTPSGETRIRIGEGPELGFAGGRPLALSFAGQPVSRLLPSGNKSEDERRLGMSTGGYVAIGVGVILAAGGVGYLVMANRCTECDQ